MTVKNNAISRVINQGGFGCIFYPSSLVKKKQNEIVTQEARSMFQNL